VKHFAFVCLRFVLAAFIAGHATHLTYILHSGYLALCLSLDCPFFVYYVVCYYFLGNLACYHLFSLCLLSHLALRSSYNLSPSPTYSKFPYSSSSHSPLTSAYIHLVYFNLPPSLRFYCHIICFLVVVSCIVFYAIGSIAPCCTKNQISFKFIITLPPAEMRVQNLILAQLGRYCNGTVAEVSILCGSQ
jgi:hypothetical protein